MPEIKTGDELASLLKKASEIEDGFENMASWEAYVNVESEELRQVLFRLISDSQRHKKTLELLISKIRVSSDQAPAPINPRMFNFKNKHELEIMDEIGRYEKLAFDLYSSVLEALKNSDTRQLLLDENDADTYTSSLVKLISEEKGHIDLVSKHAGRLQRIR